jgi:D-alanyl-lipoteichoic acid acyltransferase DltB (MBOAT superfamily)
LVVQLGLLWWLLSAYEIEASLNILSIMPLIVIGALVQFIIPERFRLWYFVLLSAAGVFFLLSIVEALVFFGIFLVFFSISQLPTSIRNRSILGLVTGLGLAYIWANHQAVIPGGSISIPIIGAIFMFRFSLYLYQSQFEKEQAPLVQRLAYFLMLPNLVFTLFPVVDYKIFKQSEDYSQQLNVQQKGVHWMIRGFVHLLLYRLIYYYFIPDPSKLFDLADLAFYALCSYLLILRLSGLFHFAAGVLCLFGFDLPQVFNNYFLSSGFSDLWRRINTYWRDYIMTVFYYPIYFKFKKLGQLQGMVITILIVFFITWLLHSYQWFWLKGSFPIRLVDAIFWGIFGVMVSASAAQQYYKKKNKIKPPKRTPLAASFFTVLQIAAMFSFMCLLWTFWNSPSVSDWWRIMGAARKASWAEWTQLFSIILVAIGIGTMLYYLLDRPAAQKVVNPVPGKENSFIYSLASLLPFTLLAVQPEIAQPLDQYLGKPASHFLENRLNEQDDAMLITGYYEDILVSNNLNSQVGDVAKKPESWVLFPELDIAKPTRDWRGHEFKPNFEDIHKGVPMVTNSWGFRDKEYALPKPANTFRIGVFGGSFVVGAGTDQEDLFNQIVNEEINKTPIAGKTIELINMATPGYYILHNVYMAENRGLDKDLDVIAMVSHSVDYNRAYKTMSRIVKRDSVPYPFVAELMDKYNFQPDESDWRRDEEKYKGFGRELTENAYAYLADICKEKGITPMFIYWPRAPEEEYDELELEQTINQVKELGFFVLDLRDIYKGMDSKSLYLASWDRHPNKKAFRIVAEAMMEQFRNSPEFRSLVEQAE